jgi:hypothetical protein
MNDLLSLTASQLNHAADLKEKINDLEQELASILGSSAAPITVPKKKGMSAAGQQRSQQRNTR